MSETPQNGEILAAVCPNNKTIITAGTSTVKNYAKLYFMGVFKFEHSIMLGLRISSVQVVKRGLVCIMGMSVLLQIFMHILKKNEMYR